jgi:asparagine synthase (glutamine-hydrolysing)
MCGISGYISLKNSLVDSSLVKEMNRLQKHRGPDGEGIWAEGNVSLGHVRLSIIDLSENASQPMKSEDGRFIITYNGEIYNYRELRTDLIKNGILLRTQSDTEVILKLFAIYGPESLDYLRGMFAFSIWDCKRRELFIARDRIGIKPLYYLLDEDKIIFASEIKAIAGVVKAMKLNLNGFYTYFRTGLFTEDETVFENVRQLLPGHFLKYDSNNKVTVEKFWDLKEHFSNENNLSFNKTIDTFDEILAETVGYHNVSDVPVGTFLSGGLDSSLITALTTKFNPHLNTISIVFPEESEYYNEEKYSNSIAEKYQTKHKKLKFSGNFLDKLPELAWFGDEPFGITSAYALFNLSAEMRNTNKVVLTGDGADELLGGYYRLYENDISKYSNFRYLLSGIAYMIRPFIPLSNDKKLLDFYLKLVSRSGTKSFNFSESSSYSTTGSLKVLNNEFIFNALDAWKRNSRIEYYEELILKDELKKKLYSLMKTRLVDEMLKKVDRMTMANSLEARVPFLDHKLVEFSAAIPSTFLFLKDGNKIQTKYILRKVSERHLDNEIVYREKHGFNIPFGQWIKEKYEIITSIIYDGYLLRNNIVDEAEVSKMIKLHNEGVVNSQSPILNLFCFECWYLAYNHNIPDFKLSI